MQPSKKEILFVDDDQLILDALRAALNRQRKTWNMRFALGGEAALELIEERSIDVIVTDMRMPGMTGTELLRRVRDRAPEAIRIVMSGQAEESLAVEAIPFTHQWLAKPTQISRVVEIISRALTSRDLVPAGPNRRALGSLNRLPILPAVFHELSLALSAPEPSSTRIGDLVAATPSLSARVLQMANSAFFGLPRVMSDAREAVRYLGFNTISQLLFTAKVIGGLDGLSETFDLLAFQRKSAATSILTASLLEGTRLQHVGRAGGLLHCLGELITATSAVDGFGPVGDGGVTAIAGADGPSLEQEAAIAAQTGGAILGLWGLPWAIVETVAHHREPSGVETDSLDAVLAVHVAQALISHALRKEQDLIGGDSETIVGLDTGILQSLRLEGRLCAWSEQADKILEANPHRRAA